MATVPGGKTEGTGMTALRIPRKFTVREYLLIEDQAETKSEFYEGEIFAMAGASPRHNIIFSNVFSELCNRLKGKKCRSFGSDQRVRISRSGLFTYPDMLIVCDNPIYDPIDPNSLINPAVLVEILSPSTEKYDRGFKLKQYQNIETVQEIVNIGQDTPLVEVHIRTPHGGWGMLTCRDILGEFNIPSLKLTIPLAEVYREVDYEKPE